MTGSFSKPVFLPSQIGLSHEALGSYYFGCGTLFVAPGLLVLVQCRATRLWIFPIGLFYHAVYSVAVAVLMWALIRFAWPDHLEDESGPPVSSGEKTS